MKRWVYVTSVIAVVLFMAGGAALDSQNTIVPWLMIAPAAVWFGLIAWANNR